MKASYKWIKDYVEVNIDPRKLADILTMAGTNVASLEKAGSDYIFDLEITANRPDCLSILGIAREVAALLRKKLNIPKELAPRKKQNASKAKKGGITITLEDPDLCPCYTARIIRDVEVGPSPEWLKNRIISAGLRPVNNIVDITNFVLLETGQPLHAFDLDRIERGIRLRRARQGERIITIDNVPRTCQEGMLVIADEKKPLAIAGVMGGEATEVNNMTRNILLESAFFNPASVRKTARALGLSSESSYRFERRIDESMVERASDRASALIAELCGGKAEPLIAAGKTKPHSRTVSFDLAKANSLLGLTLDKKTCLRILRSLGFSTEEKKGSVKVRVPGFRGDVKRSVDLAEEIARVYGYDRIPLTIPQIVKNTQIKEFIDILEGKIRRILTRLGLSEIITYSLISRRSLKELGWDREGVVSIKNPLSIDQEIMRPTLLPGTLGVFSHNFKRKAKGLSFFEIGKIYGEKKSGFSEEGIVSLGLAGLKRDDWKSHGENFDFYDLKGIIETLFGELGLGGGFIFKEMKAPALEEGKSAGFLYGGEVVGLLGEVDGKLLNKFDIQKRAFYGEIYIKKIEKCIHLEKKYSPYSKYPSIARDISLVLDKGVTSLQVIGVIKERGAGLARDIRLVDVYKGGEIPQDKKAFLYRIEYSSNERTLKDREVEKLHSEIRNALAEKLNVSFR